MKDRWQDRLTWMFYYDYFVTAFLAMTLDIINQRGRICSTDEN